MFLLQDVLKLMKMILRMHVAVSLKFINVRFQSKLKMSTFFSEYGGIAYWVGDGFCDDINNNEACNYDDGDCCGLSMKENFCVDCTCIGKSNSFKLMKEIESIIISF